MYKQERALVFAHRGASAHATENSMKAFKKAKELGADGVEIDVQLTLDGKLVVVHDLHLMRLAGVNGFVNDYLFDELRQLKIGKPFWRLFSNVRIATFDEVVSWANEAQMPLNIELKESLVGHGDVLLTMLEGLQVPQGSHFSSFHLELLQLVKRHAPQYETALIATKSLKWQELNRLTKIDTIHANKKYYKKKYLEACVVAGKKMRFYAINGSEAFLMQPNPVVVGWITDYPKKVLRIQKKDGFR